MSHIAKTSLDSQSKNDKPVVVRVKRKANQSPLESIWLEINERPLKRKRPLLDFEKLSISDSSPKEESRAKKVLVHHVETITNCDLKVDFLQSFMPCKSEARLKKLGERQNIKADKWQDKLLLAKVRNDREVLSKTARFEQIWRSRTKSEVVNEICNLYDVVRMDENRNEKEDEEEGPVLEKLVSNYLPLLREFVPYGAVQVETDINDYMSTKASKNDYVYDFYAVMDDDNINITHDDESFAFPLVLQAVEDDEFYDDPYDSDDESYDSNVEDNPANDYPDEEDSDDKSDYSNEESDVIYYEDDYY